MLRRDSRARWVSRRDGFLWGKRWYFTSGKVAAANGLTDAQYRRLMSAQNETPVLVAEGGDSDRQYWLFQSIFYWEDDCLTPVLVKALVLDQERRKERQLRNALARMDVEDFEPAARRDVIADDVRLYVWKRDGGACVRCGSQRNLEFDHIIPVIRGGSSTARNLQLLCEACNRSKGPELV